MVLSTLLFQNGPNFLISRYCALFNILTLYKMEGQSTIDNPNEQAPFGHKTKNEDKQH
jgi:hypothetical protein